MRYFLMAICIVVMGASSAHAQDEPLPDSVARAYLAYETALAAQDDDTAFDAAAAAWRAARTARIDPELIGILAENYGQLAQRRGAYGEAYEAWRNAAEISDRARNPAPERALRWYNAGVAAYANGEVDDANRCLARSVRAQPADEAVRDEDLYGNTRYLIAATTAQLGRLSGVGEHARAAIAAFQASGRPDDSMYANAHYLSGIAYYSSGDDAESAMEFNMARGILATVDAVGRQNDIRVLELWLSLARDRLSEPQLEQIDVQLAASRFPPLPETELFEITEEHNHDAVAIVRIEPRYPREAARQGIQGVSLVQFDLSAEGVPENIVVITSIPGGVFGEVSAQAVAQWRYQPMMRDGQPVPRLGVETAFVFQLR